MPAYRMKCRNPKCQGEFHRYYKQEEFEKNQYSTGWSCFNCGFPKMAIMKSNKSVKDGFVPGFQRSIRKVCNTYAEYKEELKKMGLIEIGYDDFEPQYDGRTQYWTDDILKKVYDYGVDISGREADALKSGEAFKD